MTDNEPELSEESWNVTSSASEDRQQMVAEFWRDVETTLVQHHLHKRADAASGIREYRLQVDPIGDVIYNRGVDVAANAISELLKNSHEG
jgi:hypothetical protein